MAEEGEEPLAEEDAGKEQDAELSAKGARAVEDQDERLVGAFVVVDREERGSASGTRGRRRGARTCRSFEDIEDTTLTGKWNYEKSSPAAALLRTGSSDRRSLVAPPLFPSITSNRCDVMQACET